MVAVRATQQRAHPNLVGRLPRSAETPGTLPPLRRRALLAAGLDPRRRSSPPAAQLRTKLGILGFKESHAILKLNYQRQKFLVSGRPRTGHALLFDTDQPEDSMFFIKSLLYCEKTLETHRKLH
jgi:hypothetical protein